MRAKELMIGDWVLCDMNAQSDYEFDNVDYQSYQIANGEDIDYAIENNKIGDADVYQPIPLTGDILKANGFNREGGASYWHESDRDACILHWSKDKDQLVIGSPCDECMVKMNVRYVHELQHAFRLAGIDFNIKL